MTTKKKSKWDLERISNVKQNLEQAKLNGNKIQIKIWTDILNKITEQNGKR